MSVLRSNGKCFLCGGEIFAGQEVDWVKSQDGKNRFRHPGPCPSAPNAPSLAALAAGASGATENGSGSWSVSLEIYEGPDGKPVQHLHVLRSKMDRRDVDATINELKEIGRKHG